MKNTLLTVAVLAFLVPCMYAQRDIDNNDVKSEVRVGTSYENGRSSEVGNLDFKTRLTQKLAVEGTIDGGMYYGNGINMPNDLKSFAGLGLGATYNFSPNLYVSAGATKNSNNYDTQTEGGYFEAGTKLYSGDGFVKAIEGDYNQTYRIFGGYVPKVTTDMFLPRAVLYLPKGYDVMLQAGMADGLIQDSIHILKPSAGLRIRIPVKHRLDFTVAGGINTENLVSMAQISSLSVKGFGAGCRFWLNRMTSIEVNGTKAYGTFGTLPDGTIYGVSLTRRF
jgi:hypothetical protein